VATTTTGRKPIYKHLYFWVLVSIVLGAAVGFLFPKQASEMKWLADLFVNLVKVVIAPTIFATIIVGIAGLGNLAKAGGLALKTILYFTAMTTVALAIGLIVVNIVQPGHHGGDIALNASQADATLKSASTAETGITGFILSLVPKSFVSAFTDGQLIQVLVVAILVAVAVAGMGERGAKVVSAMETLSKVMFGIIKIVMYVAPIGAFGGIAYTVGKFGGSVLGKLLWLMGSFYATCILFVIVVLGLVAKFAGFSLFKFLRYIKDELLIVLGTSSSESVLPRMMVKLEAAGAQKSVVGLTIPTGYSFNLDGTCIYLTMGAIFIAQATGHDEGRGGRHRRRPGHPGRLAAGLRGPLGHPRGRHRADRRHRPLHVRSPRHHERDRQRCRVARGRRLAEGSRQGAPDRGAEQPRQRRRRRPAGPADRRRGRRQEGAGRGSLRASVAGGDSSRLQPRDLRPPCMPRSRSPRMRRGVNGASVSFGLEQSRSVPVDGGRTTVAGFE
jgi:aerobic C4-dicarboxylate transport protein